jgi:hypothetical protein
MRLTHRAEFLDYGRQLIEQVFPARDASCWRLWLRLVCLLNKRLR